MEKKKSAKGLGDSIERITEGLGIKKWIEKHIGNCGCENRKEWLNKHFPYHKTMTPEQMKRLEVLLEKKKNVFDRGESLELYAIYNEVFGTNKKPKSCGPCAKETVTKLLAVYEKSLS
jgi:hypothetical protein